METKAAGGPAFSEIYKELIQGVTSRNKTKQMSDEELKNLKKTIDDEIIRREVVKHIETLANLIK